MFRAIFLQIGATFLVVVVSGWFSGAHAAISAGIGGLASVLPNAMFALRLSMVSRRSGASYPANFFVGEFLKIAATIGILAIAIRTYPDMHWLSLLLGLAIALHASFFAFWKKS